MFIGRGDTPAVYERFADRLAADGYAVDVRNGAPAAVDRIDENLPNIVIGIDTGAIHAADAAREHSAIVDAVVLIGLPGTDDPDSSALTTEIEIDARASCPTQQQRLRNPDIVRTGSFDLQVPAFSASGTIQVPVLALHGDDDRVSPLATAGLRYRDLGVDHLTVVESGRHDVLNSVHHRSVAAFIVLFLEEVRQGGRSPLLQRTSAAAGAGA